MLHRREFLRASALTGTAFAVGHLAHPAAAIEPVVRNGRPKFKFSLAAYSYRSLLQGSQGNAPQLTLNGFQILDFAAVVYWFRSHTILRP